MDTDKIYLLRIINNLLSNALKYSNADSTTTIKAELRSSKIIITIKDGGIGISSEDIHSIFKQFFRVNNQKVNGTGVGLAFVKAMIEKLGGEIKVESELLQGSTFTLEFPYENKPSSEITVEPSRFLKEARILIVEDKTEIQDYLIDVLKPYHTTVAKNGLEATHKLDKEVFDVIISDYMMPEMDGLQFIEWIRKKQITTPVIVLTAINKSDLRTEFLRLGVDEIMAKPFNPEELVVRVNRLLRAKPVKEDIKFSETQNEFEQKLKKLINDKIGKEEIKSIDLSEELNMSIRTFQRKVKELTGLTPNALIKEERLLKSQYLVENGLISSLKELSAQTGFKNTTYLQSIYEKRFGKKIQLK